MAATKSTPEARARELIAWYRAHARAFLEEHAPEQVAALDTDEKQISGALNRRGETVICLVGSSGVGKSTLLNAIVAQDQTIVPSGGVGPLTALATEVRYSEAPRFLAEYHPKKHLWRVAWALNSHVARERSLPEGAPDPDDDLSPDDRDDIKEEIANVSNREDPGAGKRMEEFLRTARLMVAGSQHEERPIEYLADALSVVCAVNPRWGTELKEEDFPRVTRLKQAVQMARTRTALKLDHGSNPKAIRDSLKDHAAGFLSPLIQKLEVGWPSPLLKDGLVLVDLPGVGVAGDVYQKEAQRYVRERARAIVVVVDRSGVTDSVMELLRRTGYWDKLVLSSDDPDADPCALVLAVTRVDDVALEDWRNLDEDDSGRKPRSKAAMFGEVRERMRDRMAQAVERQLATFTETDGSESIRKARETAVQAIMRSLRVHPVSAIEYRRILADDEEDRAFLKDVDQSGIPQLSSDLASLSHEHRQRRENHLLEVSGRFATTLAGQLDAIEANWKSDRAHDEAERLRGALQLVLDGKQREFENRGSSFRTFLAKTVPAKIDVAVHEAKDEAEKNIRRYLRSLQDAHWATLRAAVRRGGTFFGARHIDLPSDIALRFQDPVAGVWSQNLLTVIKQETYDLAKDTRQMVEEICEWAAQEAGAFVDQRVLVTQKELASKQVERFREVGKGAIQDLREIVKVKVAGAIERPIRAACRKFVEQGDDVGRGVKARILELFQELATEAADRAAIPTGETLKSNYEEVEKEIRKAFKEWDDPLGTVANAIVQRNEERKRRSDSQQRARVLAALESIRSAMPEAVKVANAGTVETLQ